ncbi:CDP-diacylglycerol--glycerol-3-phosphate 3-phosphatidyltransferase [Fodinicurvata sp. EGI_FJ10296]|uniref:CDP-diacylglycerol--glycerol-3-phosphate 3-phosphatidyltransferase n=1 Tax=Fodinicurvata sp. EGI_FJ10296 TaxID=3231908 RepID=UPI003451B1BF
MITSLPNALTIFRIICIPVLVGLFFIDRPWAPWTAGGIFVIAAVTDFFDGYLARKMEVVSLLGKLLDPIADKLLVAATLLTLIAFDRITGLTFLAALAILLREILISGLREFLAGMNAPGLPVSNLAKWKTGIQMTALGMLIVGDSAPGWWQVDPVGMLLLWIAAVLTMVTGWTYLQAGLSQAMHPQSPPPASTRDQSTNRASSVG